MDNNAFAAALNHSEALYSANQKQQRLSQLQQQQQKPKGPGGIAGFLVNALPAISSGIGAVGGSFIAPGVGTVGGGAAGGAIGEAIKRKILGQKEDIGQIATQGLEGGALSAVGGIGKGISSGAKALIGAEKAAPTIEKLGAGGLTQASRAATAGDNLVTQGQQMQSRGLGISGGAKVAGQELQPQDTARMLDTLKSEGIKTGNANSTARDLNTKLGQYGKQISDHFTGNNAPLNAAEKKTISANFLQNLSSTDPALEKQANILANDFEKQVNDTKGLWEFRKSLDSKIPDTKFMDENTTAKVTALKDFRGHLSDQMGEVPGMANYHALSEIKPFLGKGMRELNQPSGGLSAHIFSSGPLQKAEAVLGKGAEKAGKAIGGGDPLVRIVSKDGSETIVPQSMADATGAKGIPVQSTAETRGPLLNRVSTGIPVKFEDSTFTAAPKKEAASNLLINPTAGQVADATDAMQAKGFSTTGQVSQAPNVGKTTETPGLQGPSVDIQGEKTTLPFQQEGATTKGVINTPDVYEEIKALPISEEAKQSLISKIIRTTATAPAIPLAYPGKTAAAVTKQLVPRLPGVVNPPNDQAVTPADAQLTPDEKAILASPNDASTSGNASSTDTKQNDINQQLMDAAQKALASGDTKGLANITAFADMYAKMNKTTATKPLSSAQQQQANNAQSALGNITDIRSMLKDNPSLANKSGIPGQGSIIGGLESHALGTGTYNAALNNLTDVMGRLRSGAALSAAEEARYKALAPKAGDDTSTINYKLNNLEKLLGKFAYPQQGAGSDATDVAAALQGAQ